VLGGAGYMNGVQDLPTKVRGIELESVIDSVNSVDVETRYGSLQCSIRSVCEELPPSLVARSRVLANLLESEGHVTLPLQATAFLQCALLVMGSRPSAIVAQGAGQSFEARLWNGDLAAVIQVCFRVPGILHAHLDMAPCYFVLPRGTMWCFLSDRPARSGPRTKAVQCCGRDRTQTV
jgi:hypothetical protein